MKEITTCPWNCKAATEQRGKFAGTQILVGVVKRQVARATVKSIRVVHLIVVVVVVFQIEKKEKKFAMSKSAWCVAKACCLAGRLSDI